MDEMSPAKPGAVLDCLPPAFGLLRDTEIKWIDIISLSNGELVHNPTIDEECDV